MTTSEQLFLSLSDELNFTRTAEKAYISQQGLSDHIKRLEKKYGTMLFTRHPRVSLTEAGQALRIKLLAQLRLETDLANRLEEIESGFGATGTIRFGINSSRALVGIAPIFAEYHMQYPHVQVELFLGETIDMIQQMERGKLDCFLGVNPAVNAPQYAEHLADEQAYIMMSKSYLLTYLNEAFSEQSLPNGSITLKNFQGLPMAGNNSRSTTHDYLNSYLSVQGISIHKILAVSDYNVLDNLCRTGTVAAFVPQFFVPTILKNNDHYPLLQQIYVLPLNEVGTPLHVCLVYNQADDPPRFLKAFEVCVKKQIMEQHADLRRVGKVYDKFILH